MDFDWTRARAFLATADHGTLSAAGQALGIAQPTVGRQVAALEADLGIVLFERSGNRLSLTPAGLELLEHVREMEAAANRVLLAASGRARALEGEVTITASEAISAYLLPPVLGALRRDHPGLDVEVVASNTSTDLLRREADLAIRNFQPAEPELVARRLRTRDGGFYATADYLEQLDVKGPSDLLRAEFLGWSRGPGWRESLNALLGIQLTPGNVSFVCSNHLVQWQMCKAGLGICVMMAEVGDLEPGVVRVLPDVLPSVPVQMWLTSHREVKTSARVRLVFDRLVEAFS